VGVPTSEVGYTSATTRRGDHKVHKGHVVALAKKIKIKLKIKKVTPLTCHHGMYKDKFTMANTLPSNLIKDPDKNYVHQTMYFLVTNQTIVQTCVCKQQT
jgi:prolyl-tRNA synthetase